MKTLFERTKMAREYVNTINMYKGLHENLSALTTKINPLAPLNLHDDDDDKEIFRRDSTAELISIEQPAANPPFSSSSYIADLLELDSNASYAARSESGSLLNETNYGENILKDDNFFDIPPYAIAKYNFIAQNSNELSLKMGQMVYLNQHVNEEWMEGDIDGVRGFFPTNFVSIIVDCTIKQSDYLESSLPINIYLFEEGANYRVNFSFTAQIEGDLTISEGEVVSVIKQENEDWVRVENIQGSSGIVPCNHLNDERESRFGDAKKEDFMSWVNNQVYRMDLVNFEPEISLPVTRRENPKEQSLDSLIAKNLENLEVSLMQSRKAEPSPNRGSIFSSRNETPSPAVSLQDLKSVPSKDEVSSIYSTNPSEISGDSSRYLYARVTRSAASQIKTTTYYEPPRSTDSSVIMDNHRTHEYDDSVSENCNKYESGNRPLRPAPPIPSVSIEIQCNNNSPIKEEKNIRIRKINTIRKQIQDKEKQLEDQLLNELDMYQDIAVAKGINYECLNQKMDDCQENIETLSDEIQKLQASLTNEEILVDEENIVFRSCLYENEEVKNEDKQSRKNGERYQLVMKELLATEKKYHEHIQGLISLINSGKNERTRSLTEDILLSTLRDIKEISEKILKAPNYSSVLDVLLNNSVKMKSSYTKYCIYHPKVEEVLEKLEIIPSEDINARFNIKSSFIMPVQRILKYPLIINELVKCVHEKEETEYLLRVQGIMADVASSINESKGRKDIVDKYKCMSECGIHQKMIKWNIHGLEKKSYRIKNRLLSSIGFDTMMIDLDFQAIEKRFIFFCQSINYFMIEMKSTNLHLYNSLLSQLNLSECVHEFYSSSSPNSPGESKQKLVDIHKAFLSPYWRTFVCDHEDKTAVLCELLCQSFQGPKRLIQKRRDKYVDLCGALVKLKKNKEMSKQADLKNTVSNYRSTYKALNVQLTKDIPRFLGLTMGLFKRVIITYSTSRAKLYGKITTEFLQYIKSSRLKDYYNEEEFIAKYENVIREIKDVSSLLKNQDVGAQGAPVVVQDDQVENSAVQCRKQRAKLRLIYEPSDLYFVTKTYLHPGTTDLKAFIGDLVGVLKKEEGRWIVDNGTTQAYIPSAVLTPFGAFALGNPDLKPSAHSAFHTPDATTQSLKDSNVISSKNVVATLSTEKKLKETPLRKESAKEKKAIVEPDYDAPHSVTGRMSNHSYEEIATSDFNSESPDDDLSPIYEEINGLSYGSYSMALIKGSFQSESSSCSSSKGKGKFFYSLFDFVPEQKEDNYGQVHVKNMLPLTQGQVVRVLSVEGHDWWFAENRKGRRGYVPKSYLKTYKASILMN